MNYRYIFLLMNILIIEDDIYLSQNIKKVFEKKVLSNRIKILDSYLGFINEVAIIESYDLILIDILLWDEKSKNWIDILQIIREKHINIPLVIISWFNDIAWLKRAFDHWANDYIVKPFRLKELELRVFKWFKTYFCDLNLNNNSEISYKWLSYSLLKNEYYFNDQIIELTKKNKYLLSILLKNQEILLTEHYLISKIWWDLDFTVNRNLRVNVLRLKQSLKPFWIDERVHNIRGEGYMFKK